MTIDHRVGAVIVTYRRPETVQRTVAAVLLQTAGIDEIVVVDNDADPAVAASLSALSPRVTYVAAAGNDGFAAGLALGIDHLRVGLDPDWMWLLDDDSPPVRTALAAALHVAAAHEATSSIPLGVVANRGGHIVAGRIRHDLSSVAGTAPQRADFTLVDGTIVSAATVAAVGLPRADLFSMLEDIEYTTRIRLAGFALLVRQADESTFLHMGSQSEWRHYYQARNHLRIAIDLRQWSWLWGWWVRETGIGLHLVSRRRGAALRLRWRGAFDAVRNRMGKVVEPS
jgi:rhamnopyranosyl-N-acetylglucosaminyl-diphospho-decaprenol beta-1,3/1,4-galactofuranosyltransferase